MTSDPAGDTTEFSLPTQVHPNAVHSNAAPQASSPGGEVILEARDLSVKASWGHIFGPVNLSIRAGGVTVLKGSGGRGRTALLLTLAGRMKPSSGSLVSFGQANNTKQLFNRAQLAFIDEVDGIGQTIRVRDVLTEQLRWTAPWYKFVGEGTEEDLERLCRPVFGDLLLPQLSAYVEELPELTSALFRIAIACVRQPEVLVVGGIDNLARIANSQMLLGRLVEIGRHKTVITCDVNGVDPKSGVRDVIPVPNLTDDEFVRLELGDLNR